MLMTKNYGIVRIVTDLKLCTRQVVENVQTENDGVYVIMVAKDQSLVAVEYN